MTAHLILDVDCFHLSDELIQALGILGCVLYTRTFQRPDVTAASGSYWKVYLSSMSWVSHFVMSTNAALNLR